MGLTFLWAEKQVDDQVKQHPDGYRDDDKIFAKDKEELSEIKNRFSRLQSVTDGRKSESAQDRDRRQAFPYPVLCQQKQYLSGRVFQPDDGEK